MAYPFPNISSLRTFIDQYITENHNNEITGENHNQVENGLLDFIIRAARNWDKATVIANAGLYQPSSDQSILIFKPSAIGSIELMDNQWHEWTIVNQTPNSKQITGDISSYVKIDGTFSSFIPATISTTLVLGTDNKWYEASNRGGGSSGSDIFGRLEFTVGGSPLVMSDGDTILEILQPGIVQDSVEVEYVGAGELPRTLTDQQSYGIDYSDPEKVTFTFLTGVQNGQTYIVHYTYRT